MDRRTQLAGYKACVFFSLASHSCSGLTMRAWPSQEQANNYQLTQDVLDWLIPASTLGLVNLSEGTVGLVG